MKNLCLLVLFLLCTITATRAQTNYDISTSDGSLHFKTFGEGLPVLIINGGPGMNSNGFEGLASALADNNQTIIFDQRGTGNSELSEINEHTVTMDLMAEDIEAIRKHLGIDKWVVMGHSFGGILASYYAGIYADQTLGLIQSSSGGLDLELLNSLDIPGKLTPAQRDSLRFWTRRISSGDTTYNAQIKRASFLAAAYLYDDTLVPQVAPRFLEGNMVINGLVFQDLRRIRYDCKDELSSYKKPVLILQGTDDIISVSIARRMHEVFSNSELILLEDTGHYGWIEKPDKYYSAIHKFLHSIQS